MALRLLALAALVLPLSLASPVLLGFSTRPHFRCADALSAACATVHPEPLPTSALRDLIAHLSNPSTDRPVSDSPVASLPLARAAAQSPPPPALLLVVRSPSLRADAPTVLRQLSVALAPAHAAGAVDGASSFHALSSQHAHFDDVSALSAVKLSSVHELLSLASDHSSSAAAVFGDDGRAHVVSLSVQHEHEEGLLAALQAVSRRANGDIAVLWAARAEADTGAEADAAADAPDEAAAPKEDEPADAPKEDEPADAPETEDVESDADTAAADAKADGADSSSANVRKMYRPEVTESQLAGLLVALVFLILFVPGFMCLWRIQPPQSFDTKMQ